MTPDLYGAWLTAGDNLHTAVDWVVRNWPNLAVAASLTVVAWRLIRWAIRPHLTRRAINYLRQKGDETP